MKFQKVSPSKSKLIKCKNRFNFASNEENKQQELVSNDKSIDCYDNQESQWKRINNKRQEQVLKENSDDSIESSKSSISLFDQQANKSLPNLESLIISQSPRNEKSLLVRKFLQKAKITSNVSQKIVKDKLQPQKGDVLVMRQQKIIQSTSQNSNFQLEMSPTSINDFYLTQSAVCNGYAKCSSLEENTLLQDKTYNQIQDFNYQSDGEDSRAQIASSQKIQVMNANSQQIIKIKQMHNQKLLPTLNKKVDFNIANATIKRKRNKQTEEERFNQA